MRVGVGVVAGLAGLAVAHAAWAGLFTTRPFDDIAAVDIAETVVAHEHLTALSSNCLEFHPTAEAPSKYLVEVREHHSTECGGDPAVAPLLFTLDVDGARKTVRLHRAGDPDRPLKWRKSR